MTPSNDLFELIKSMSRKEKFISPYTLNTQAELKQKITSPYLMRLAGKIFMTSLPLKQQWGKARREKVFR